MPNADKLEQPQSPLSGKFPSRAVRSGSSAEKAKSSSKKQHLQAQLGSPRSQSASRCRMPRFDSALGQADTLAAPSKQVPQRAGSAREMREEQPGGTPIPDRPSSPKSRNRSRSRLSDARDLYRDLQTIPIAASPSILDSSHHVLRHYRPVSRMGHQRRSNSMTNINGNFYVSGFERPGPPGNGCPVPNPACRATSRGRQPGPRNPPTGSDSAVPVGERASSADSTRNAVLHDRFNGRSSAARGHHVSRRSSYGPRSRSE